MVERLISVSEAAGYWTLQAQILAPNTASRALHRRCGFREVGIRERFGHIDDVWNDVILMERRSQLTGGPGLPTRSCEDG